MNKIDKTWHLAQTDKEIKFTDFELQLWRVFYGFARWQEECERSANGTELTANELAVLHIIRMKDKPKTVPDISRLLNRDDTFNLKYSIRKLLKMGLIEKTKDRNKKAISYTVTQLGIANTDNYTLFRKNILIETFIKNSELNLEELTHSLSKIKAVYDEADRTAASYAIHKK